MKFRRMRRQDLKFLGENQNAYRHLMGKPESNTQLGRPSRRWNDNIKMDLEEIGRESVNGFIWC